MIELVLRLNFKVVFSVDGGLGVVFCLCMVVIIWFIWLSVSVVVVNNVVWLVILMVFCNWVVMVGYVVLWLL